MWEGRNSKKKMKLCKRMMKKFLSLFFDVKVFFSSYFHPKNQLGFECKERAENVCYTWFQRKFFNKNISLYLFASCIMGEFSTWLLLHVYVWQTSVKEREIYRESIEMKLSRENLIWFPFFLFIRNHNAMWKKKRIPDDEGVSE